MLSTWLNFGEILIELIDWSAKIFFCEFFRKILNPFSPVEQFICHILGMVGPVDVKQKRKGVNWMLSWLGYLWLWPLLTLTFDLEFSRSNCISGMGGPIVMEWKGRESIGCPDVKHYGNESTGCCADWVTFDLEFSWSYCISGMGGSIVMERKGLESLGCPDVKH